MSQTRAEQQAAFRNGKQVDPEKVGVFLAGKQVDMDKSGAFFQGAPSFEDLMQERSQYSEDSKEYKILTQQLALLCETEIHSSAKDFLGFDPNAIIQKDKTAKDFF
jgi:hypothetical protein